MTALSDSETAPRGGPVPDSTFLKQLVAVIRAEDSHGTWDGKPDTELLAEFIVTPEERRAIPIICDPEPEVLWRMARFHDAVGLMIERRSGCTAAQMDKFHHEGFGRVVLISGRLVVVSRHLRDVHRWGFPTWARLAEAGEALVDEAVALIARFPEAARA